MNRPLLRFATTVLIAMIGITMAFAGSLGGGTRMFVGESIPVVDKAIVTPAPQPKQISQPQQQSTTPAAKPAPGPNPKPTPGPDPKPGPKPRPSNDVSVIYYTDGFEVNIGQPQQTEQQLQPQVEQVSQNMPSAAEIQEKARPPQGAVTQKVEQAVQQLPQPTQETSNEPIIITPNSVNPGNDSGSKSRSKSKWTYGVPGMTGGEGNGPLIYNP